MINHSEPEADPDRFRDLDGYDSDSGDTVAYDSDDELELCDCGDCLDCANDMGYFGPDALENYRDRHNEIDLTEDDDIIISGVIDLTLPEDPPYDVIDGRKVPKPTWVDESEIDYADEMYE